MKQIVIGCLAFLPVVAMAGENGGVASTNYSAGLSLGHHEDANTINTFGGITFPLHEYAGSSLYVGAGKTDGDNDILDTSYYYLGGSVFLRDFNVGKIGIGASYEKTYFDNSPFVSFDGDEKYNYTISGQYYIQDFTVGASRTVIDSKNSNDADFAGASIGWYWQDNTRLTLGTSWMDSSNRYNVDIAFQPNALNNSTKIALSYSNNVGGDYVGLSATYYFDTLVTLKDRDRKY